MRNCPEVLAPAGDFECLQAAVRFGADAVYLGGSRFGMRAASANFSEEELQKGVALAHQNGVRVYLTCNTLPTNEEIEALPEFLKGVERAGVDAVIVTDIGVLSLVKRIIPEMEVHISTQTGVVNYLTAAELHRMGARRVVLARELSLDDIARIRDKTPPELEIETFVHGAMCVSFSGRCLLSQYLTGRDANRGECAQPCRWGYHLVEEKRPGLYFPIEEDERGSYILNAKDLCMIEHVDKLAAAGISSFKIEGRAKSSYYVSVVTNAYRNAVDLYRTDPAHYQCPKWLYEEVRKVSHRQYSTGFYFGRPEQGQYYENGGYIRGYDVVALVDEYRDGMLYCTQKNKFNAGDVLELLEPRAGVRQVVVSALYNEAGEAIESAPHPLMKCSFPVEAPVKAGAILRKLKHET
ncbi:MAG: peptidase U32 family protein [Oscillospiraceae bacterium]